MRRLLAIGARPSTAGAMLLLLAATAIAQIPEAPSSPSGAPAVTPTQRTGKVVVNLKLTGDEAVKETLKKIVEAEADAQERGGSAATILQRAQTQRDLVIRTLRAKGFYGNRVSARAAGRNVDDVSALDAIDALPPAADVPLDIDIDTGPVFKVGTIDVTLQGATNAKLERDKFSLSVGQPVDSAKILSTDEEIVLQLQQQGYALARVVKREVVVDHDSRTARATWLVDTGPAASMGSVTFTGMQRTDADFLTGRVPFKPGEPYHPDRINDLRTRLTDLGIFSSVRVVRADALDAQGELPVTVEVTERLPRSIGFAASYATSEGAGLRAYWLHRNLSGVADSLRLTAEATGLVERKLVDTGFAVIAAYRRPDFLRSDQVLTVQAGALREINDAYHRRSILATAGVERTISKGFVVRAGVGIETEIVETAERRDTYLPFSVPMGMTLDRSNDLLDPTSGYRLALDAIPYFDIRNAGKPFVKLRATGSTYFDVSGKGATVIALRASIGAMPGASKDAVPPDKRFYAGGGGSVRGFDYQSAGPRDRDHRPLGGQSIVEASVELRQRITQTFGAVAFVDAGTTYSGAVPGKGDSPRIGAGLGVRYYSEFGPIRADVAVPINKRPGDSMFGVYVSIGQAF